MALKLSNREQVLAAIAEFDQIGREAFLRKYGYRPARQYVLVHNGREYDSKAIAGVAAGLSAYDFSGGMATVQKELERLGFTLIENKEGTTSGSPRVLAQSEGSAPLDGILRRGNRQLSRTALLQSSKVPSQGPLEPGAIYRRADLHSRFSGNPTAGIVPSTKEPVILCFHTEEPSQQFYKDGWDKTGIYRYTGAGRLGDMSWRAENRAIRDHVEERRDLYLFERAQRTDGLWRLIAPMECVGFDWVVRPDREGNSRQAIVFSLQTLGDEIDHISPSESESSLEGLRLAALEQSQDHVTTRTRIQTYARRSRAIRVYAIKRAGGMCEGCRNPAPFEGTDGVPFLEVHHIDRIADGGPDRPDRVAAVCPNCHRRCHMSRDAQAFNESLRERVERLEALLATAAVDGLDVLSG